MAYGRDESIEEIEATVEYTSAKARLIIDNFTGLKYWLPKSQTIDMNECGESVDGQRLFKFVVSGWWSSKKEPVE